MAPWGTITFRRSRYLQYILNAIEPLAKLTARQPSTERSRTVRGLWASSNPNWEALGLLP